jgi:hypothetical protein
MHLKVFVKLKKTLQTLSSGQNNPKKPKKIQKTPKNPKKSQKKPTGLFFFLFKPGFFPTLLADRIAGSGNGSTHIFLLKNFL